MRFISFILILVVVGSCQDGYLDTGNDYTCHDSCYIFEGMVTHAITGGPGQGELTLRYRGNGGIFSLGMREWTKSVSEDGSYSFQLNADPDLYFGGPIKEGDFDLSFRSNAFFDELYTTVCPDSIPQINQPFVFDLEVNEIAPVTLRVEVAQPDSIDSFWINVRYTSSRSGFFESVSDVKPVREFDTKIYGFQYNEVTVGYIRDGQQYRKTDSIFGEPGIQKTLTMQVP